MRAGEGKGRVAAAAAAGTDAVVGMRVLRRDAWDGTIVQLGWLMVN